MADQDAKFLTGPLWKHITIMASTSALGFLLLFVVDLVDMVFISMLGVSELAAAVGFAGTILFFSTSVSIGLSIAAGALVAQALGRGEGDRARETMTHVMIVGFVITAIIAALMWVYMYPITALIGAQGATQDLAVNYLRIIVPTMPVMMLGMVASAVLRAHGEARLSTYATMAAGITNAALDPIFIFALDMGLNGAAVASVFARIAMVIVAFWPIFRKYQGIAGLSFSSLRPDLKPIWNLAAPAILANVATPVGAAYVTRVAAEFGEEAVAGMAIIGRVTPIAFALIFALSMSIGPIVGQNYGAKQYDRVRAAFTESILLTAIYTGLIVILLYFLRAPIADLFGATGTTRDLVYLFCGPLSLAWIFNGIIFVANASYNNLGHPYYSMWINWGRNTLGVIPFVWAGAQLWGAEGVLIGQMAGGVIVALVAWWLALRVMVSAEDQGALPDPRHQFRSHERSFRILNHRR